MFLRHESDYPPGFVQAGKSVIGTYYNKPVHIELAETKYVNKVKIYEVESGDRVPHPVGTLLAVAA